MRRSSTSRFGPCEEPPLRELPIGLLLLTLAPAVVLGSQEAESSPPIVQGVDGIEQSSTTEHSDQTLTATVLGEDVRASDPDKVQQTVVTRLFDRYAKQHGIRATEAEIDAFVDKMRRGMRAEGLTAEDALTPEERIQARQMRRDMARSMIRHWKIDRALHAQYGGRIIFQQFGPEPLDAYRQYLEERQAAGDFKIDDPTVEAHFWRYFTDDSIHDFHEPGSAEEARAFANPPWE